MTTTTLRSTSTLTEYVKITDGLARHALILKDLTRRESELRPDVLAEIGERRVVTVRGQVRILTPGKTESIRRVCTDLQAVQACLAAGLKTHERSASYVAPAAFTSYVKQGRLDSLLYVVDVTNVVLVH